MKLIPIAGRGNEYLFNPEGSKVIWVSRAKKGYKRLQRSLFTESPGDARKKRDELFATAYGEKPQLAERVRATFADRWSAWEKTKARKSQATRDSIRFSGKHLLELAGGMVPEDITVEWWEGTYIPAKLKERPDRKFFNEWKWLTTFLKHLHAEGHIKRMPRLENPDGETEQGLFLSDSEIAYLYEEAGHDLRLQIDLGLKHFMRRSEVLLLPWAEVDFEKGLIALPAERTKIRKGRDIPLSRAVLDELRERRRSSASPYVFPSPADPQKPVGRTGNNSAWKAAIARILTKGRFIQPNATFHDLRHSGLTRAFAATNRYAEICFVAGLRIDVAQRTYLHLTHEHTRFVADLVDSANRRNGER